jgi:hypothetical protein
MAGPNFAPDDDPHAAPYFNLVPAGWVIDVVRAKRMVSPPVVVVDLVRACRERPFRMRRCEPEVAELPLRFPTLKKLRSGSETGDPGSGGVTISSSSRDAVTRVNDRSLRRETTRIHRVAEPTHIA